MLIPHMNKSAEQLSNLPKITQISNNSPRIKILKVWFLVINLTKHANLFGEKSPNVTERH